ncbi:hypothetical protein TRICI_006475 [Trichomonascus ciferrii]|uniref:Zn(2)-C6 fungal-type domain-containing protein n=1 Tax=Trichomonascus ciferrii TaxID=44093 RepID=A0A642UGY6_9ASCO|nr:hypothetical protein TRICI_006475 [Trichomonascus ciferrii]
MASEVEQFAENWRKRRACTRCRRIKVRCEYDSPLSETCRRCQRAGVECHPGLKPLEGSESTGQNTTYAWVEKVRLKTRPTDNSTEEEENKIAQLERIIQEAQGEITNIKARIGYKSPATTASSTGNNSLYNGGYDTGSSSSMMLDAENSVFRRRDCFQTALDVGFFSYEVALESYNSFRSSLIGNVAAGVNMELSLEEMREDDNLLALAMVTSSFCCHARPGVKLEKLILFLEHVMIDRMYYQAEFSLNLLRIQLMIAHYIMLLPDMKTWVNIMFTMVGSLFLDLCSEEELLKMVGDKCENEHEWEDIRSRIRAGIGVCASVMTVSANANMPRLAAALPSMDLVQEVIFKVGTIEDRVGMYYVRMVSMYLEGTQMLTSPQLKDQSVHLIRMTLDNYKKKMNDTITAMSMYVGSPDQPVLAVVRSAFLQLHISLNECGMNQMMLFAEDEAPNEMLMIYAQEIVSKCRQLNESFKELCDQHDKYYFPRYMYFRPLKALTALIRIRLLMWSRGFDIPVDIHAELSKVKAAWTSVKSDSYNARGMHFKLEKVEQWVNVKLEEFDKNNVSEEVTTLSARTIRKILDGIKDKPQTQPNPPMSAVSRTNSIANIQPPPEQSPTATNDTKITPGANAAFTQNIITTISGTAPTPSTTIQPPAPAAQLPPPEPTDVMQVLSAPMFDSSTAATASAPPPPTNMPAEQMELLIRELFSGSTW